MRRRELQSITLKLTELKEYEQIRAERLAAEKAKLAECESDQDPGTIKDVESIATSADSKSKDEIKERIGMTM